jgi:hypothetical protein
VELQQMFNTIVYACNECLLNKEQRIVTDNALQTLIRELSAYAASKKEKEKEIEKNHEGTDSAVE